MARIYVCDRCQVKSPTWNTTCVELPAPSFWGKKLDVELCETCLKLARNMLNNFMGNK